MKVTINLLPSERKDELAEKKSLKVILKIGLAAFFALLIFSAFLIFCFWTINIQIKSVKNQQEQLTENKKYNQVQEVQKFAENYYKQTSRLEKSLKQQNYYWDLFSEINQVIPENIYLKEMSLQDGSIFLSGFSSTREVLLKFKEDLEANEKFSRIESPISNLTSSENINFNFKAEIK